MKNLPNKITVTRILLLPLVIFFYFASFIPAGRLIAFIIFAVAALTDFLDGFIARKTNQITELGIFLDPIADKLLATTGLTLLIISHTVPPVLAAIFMFVMVLRDYVVTGLRQLAQTKGVIIAADKTAKIKANFLYFTLCLGLFISYFNSLPTTTSDFVNTSNIIFYVLIGITGALIALSGIVYITNNFTVFKDNKNTTKN